MLQMRYARYSQGNAIDLTALLEQHDISTMSLVNSTMSLVNSTMSLVNVSLTESVDSGLPRSYFQASAILLYLVSTLGFVGNFIAIFVYIKTDSLHTPTNYFLVSIAVSDFCMSIISYFSAASSYAEQWLFGKEVCIALSFAAFAFGMVALYNHVLIAVDRYILVVCPALVTHITKKSATVLILLVWVVSVFWAIGPLIGWSKYGFEGANVTCGLEWNHNDTASVTYIAVVFIFCLFIPCIVMAYCYYKVYMKMRELFSTWSFSPALSRRNMRLQKKIIITTATICSFYMVCWLPYSIMLFSKIFKYSNELPAWFISSPALFAKSSCVWNPIIYIVTNKQFRAAFFAMIRKIRCPVVCDHSPSVPDFDVIHQLSQSLMRARENSFFNSENVGRVALKAREKRKEDTPHKIPNEQRPTTTNGDDGHKISGLDERTSVDTNPQARQASIVKRNEKTFETSMAELEEEGRVLIMKSRCKNSGTFVGNQSEGTVTSPLNRETTPV